MPWGTEQLDVSAAGTGKKRPSFYLLVNIYYKHNLTEWHTKAATPGAAFIIPTLLLHLIDVSKEYLAANTIAFAFLPVTFIFPFKDKIASKLFQSISFHDFGNIGAQ